MTYLREQKNTRRSYPKPLNSAIAGCRHVLVQRDTEIRGKGGTKRKRRKEISNDDHALRQNNYVDATESKWSIFPFSAERHGEKFSSVK